MKLLIASALALLSLSAAAETPQQLIAGYAAEAARGTPGFAPSAERGARFYTQRFTATRELPSCVTCHTDRPAAAGRHAITDKPIKPLAPAANGERFSDRAKVEKWFRRNCNEVVGRECSAAEKADFIQFLTVKG